MNSNFMGKDGFVWWIGVVENRNDPLKMGALRVRIIGWHSESLTDMPSEMLPWAPVLKPCAASNFSTDVKEGDWVTGFFQDGNAGQKPIVIGKYEGIKSINDNYSQGFSPQLTAEQRSQLPVAPNGVVLGGSQIDEPTTPRTSRGELEGTLIEQTNKEVVHVCDIATQMKRSVIWERLKHSQFVSQIRQAIEALIKSFGNSPDSISQRIIELAKWLRRKLKEVQDLIQELNDYLQITVEVARQLRAIIDWILSLPARLKAALQNCLAAFISGVSSLLSDVLTLPSASGNDIGEVLGEVKKTFDQAGATINQATNLLAVPAQIVDAVLTPASVTDVSKVQSAVDSYISQQATSNQNATNVYTTKDYQLA